ncbi:hypothetical protein ACLRAG_08880, partial [Gallibacterium anatis]
GEAFLFLLTVVSDTLRQFIIKLRMSRTNMNLSVKNNLKNFLLIGIYSVILLFSEILYRNIFSIPSLTRYFESYIIIFILVSLFFFSKYRITKFLIAFFYFLCVVVNNVHFQIYQS